MRVKAMLMSAAGVILLTIGAASVIVGGVGSFLKQNTIAVDRDGRVFDSEGNEIGADRRPLTMSPLRKLVCEYIPQACNSPLDWVYWFAFFGGLGVASLGWNLKERGSAARAVGSSDS